MSDNNKKITPKASSESCTTNESRTTDRLKPEFNDVVGEYQRFEEFLITLAGHFIYLPNNKIEAELDKAIYSIGQYLNIDRLSLTRYSKITNRLVPTNYYTGPGITDIQISYLDEHLPWVANNLLLKKKIFLDGNNLPEDYFQDTTIDRQFSAEQHIKSSLILPLVHDDILLGGLHFVSVSAPINWPDLLIDKLELAAAIVSSALWRLESDLLLKSHMDFEDILLQISTKFIDISEDKVEDAIEQSFERIATFLEVDIIAILFTSSDDNYYHVNKSWINDKIIKPIKIVTTPENVPWFFQRWLKGEKVKFSFPDELPKEAIKDIKELKRVGIKSHISIPFFDNGKFILAVGLITVEENRTWPKGIERQLQLIGEIFSNALSKKKAALKLKQVFSEMKQLKDRYEQDYTYLRDEIKLVHNFEEIIGNSKRLKEVLSKVEQVAPTDANVLILGETGTGKELIARAVHNQSLRKERPLVKVNCATLPKDLVESELFGHEAGAFTGAVKKQIGRFEFAHKGTLFLDEIGELPIELQAKILRVVQDGEFERLGNPNTFKVDVRVIAATNRDLEKLVKEGLFREDLWYRLNVFSIYAYPLREREEDIPLLVSWFVDKFKKKYGKHIELISSETMTALRQYPWPGNIRELENMVERSVINTNGSVLKLSEDLSGLSETPQKGLKEKIHELEYQYILQALESADWKIEGKNGAAAILKLPPSTLRSRMEAKMGQTRYTRND